MTVAKRRFYVSNFEYSKSLPIVKMYELFESIEANRFTNLPEQLDETFNYKCLYSYNEVLMFEIAMMVRGDDLKSVAPIINVPYHRLLRIVNKYHRGCIKDDSHKIESANAYDMQQILSYTDEVKPYLEKAIPENTFKGWW